MWVWTAWVHFQIYFKSKYYITIGSVAGWILICGGTGDSEGQTTVSYTRISPVQFSRSVVSDSATPWITARQDFLSITNSRSLLKLMSIESVMSSSHLILCRSLLLLPSIFPSIRVESALRIRWPKYWSFSFSISPSDEYSGLISFRTDWFDLLGLSW